MEEFGLELMHLEELCINHGGSEDLSILECLDYLPECVTLNFFEIYETEESPHKTYSVSDLIESWIPVRSQSTRVELDATFEIDIVSKIVKRSVELVSTKSGASAELTAKMKNLEALDLDTINTRIVLLDNETGHKLTICHPESSEESE